MLLYTYHLYINIVTYYLLIIIKLISKIRKLKHLNVNLFSKKKKCITLIMDFSSCNL